MFDKRNLIKTIETAIAEDVGLADITTVSTIPEGTKVLGRFIAKAKGILCGIDIARTVFEYIDSEISLNNAFCDGDEVNKGDVIATVEGPAVSVLTAERLALNFMQRLSGIATKTREMVKKVEGYPVKILDTRKTTPCLRMYEKYAVRIGGGYNHRFSLSDGVLIKDNHISAAGGITSAVKRARDYVPHTLKIEVEVETIEQVHEALSAGADIIMLDNMTTEVMREAVGIINKRALVEASGNMDEKDLREIASVGVDFISIGAITNAVKPLDISLKFEETRLKA